MGNLAGVAEQEVEGSRAYVGEGGISEVVGSNRVTAGVIMWSLEEFRMAEGRLGGRGRRSRSTAKDVGEVETARADIGSGLKGRSLGNEQESLEGRYVL